MAKSVSTQATIRPSSPDTFAVIDSNGVLLRDGFRSRGHAAMWAARQKIYEGTTPRRRQQEIPPELVDESIKPIPLLAKMSGKGYPRLLAEAKAGLYGELYQLGKNSFGLKFGNWKRGMAARIVK